MHSPTTPVPLPPSLLRPPIDHLPTAARDALADLAGSARAWDQQPAPLTPMTTCGLWTGVVGSAGVGAWLIAVVSGAVRPEGFAYAVATLGLPPALLLGLAIGCVALLLGAAAVTRGLTRANVPQLTVIGVGALAGMVCLLGVVLLLTGIALAMTLICIVLATIVEHD